MAARKNTTANVTVTDANGVLRTHNPVCANVKRNGEPQRRLLRKLKGDVLGVVLRGEVHPITKVIDGQTVEVGEKAIATKHDVLANITLADFGVEKKQPKAAAPAGKEGILAAIAELSAEDKREIVLALAGELKS